MDELASAQTASYDDALKALADALVQVWTVCEDAGVEAGSGVNFGGNLPEALSYALGMAAVALGLDLDDSGNPEDADFAAEGLVRHRPGSWEAVHIRALVFPPDLLPHS
jgi:hypothetical protein